MITIKDVLTQGTNRLKKLSDTETPYLDALLLMGHSLKKSKEQLIASFDDTIWEVDAIKFGKFLQLRIQGLPIAYITKRKEFYGLEFYVDQRVLIPRPDTEILVETALAFADGRTDISVLDLCAGSGCIGISIMHTLGGKDITLADLSKEALSVCSLNARNILGWEPEIIHSDLFEHIEGTYDLICTNPPYLTVQEAGSTAVKRRREPEMALASGNDGLDHIRKIVSGGFRYLNDGGHLLIEGGFDQGNRIKELMIGAGYTEVRIHEDLGGRQRVVSGRKG